MRQLVRAAAGDPALSQLREQHSGQGRGVPEEQHSGLVRAISALLDHCTLAVPGDAQLWDLCAVWAELLGNQTGARDCRLKQFRAAVAVTGWEKDEELIDSVVSAAVELVDAHETEVRVGVLSDAVHLELSEFVSLPGNVGC